MRELGEDMQGQKAAVDLLALARAVVVSNLQPRDRPAHRQSPTPGERLCDDSETAEFRFRGGRARRRRGPRSPGGRGRAPAPSRAPASPHSLLPQPTHLLSPTRALEEKRRREGPRLGGQGYLDWEECRLFKNDHIAKKCRQQSSQPSRAERRSTTSCGP